jgi:hypothetical protein
MSETEKHHKQYTCDHTDAYARWLSGHRNTLDHALAKAPLPLSNAHLLLYGPSWLRQLGLVLLCMHMRHAELTDVSRGFDERAARAPAGMWNSTEEGTFRFAALNLSISFIINAERYQEPSQARRTLPRLLSSRHGFTHAALMQPHPSCFFRWARNATLRRSRPYGPHDLCPRGQGTDVGSLVFAPELYDIFDGASLRWVEVVDWIRPSFGKEMWRNWTSRNAQRVFRTQSLMARMKPYCGVRKCGSSGRDHNHQCTPGPPDILAASLLARLFSNESSRNHSLDHPTHNSHHHHDHHNHPHHGDHHHQHHDHHHL